MAADQERNKNIAEALGFKQIHDESIYNGWWEIPGGGLTRDLPDFSKPEWQIKIQEKVRALMLKGDDDQLVVRYRRSGVILGKVNSVVTFQADTDREAYENALLWLAKRR